MGKNKVMLRCDVIEVKDYTNSWMHPDIMDKMRYLEDEALIKNQDSRFKKIEELVDEKIASLASREFHNLKVCYDELVNLMEKYSKYLHNPRYKGNELIDCFMDKLSFPERQSLRISYSLSI